MKRQLRPAQDHVMIIPPDSANATILYKNLKISILDRKSPAFCAKNQRKNLHNCRYFQESKPLTFVLSVTNRVGIKIMKNDSISPTYKKHYQPQS